MSNLGDQSGWDELLAIRKQLEASRPEIWIDVIMVTGSPNLAMSSGKTYRFQYEGRCYMVVNRVDFHKIEFEVRQLEPGHLTGTVPLPSLMGIPVVEDDELLTKMLTDIIAERVSEILIEMLKEIR